MRSVGLVALLAVTACGGDSLGLDDLETASRTALCTRVVRCGLVASIEACEAYFPTSPPSSFASARAAGRLEFDGEQAQRCQDALAALSCDETSRGFRAIPEPCTRMFRGRIADGEVCAFDEECRSARCDRGLCQEGVCCMGTCGPTRAAGDVGDVCDRSSECRDGFCDIDRMCHALVAQNATCARDEQCDYGLACVSPSPSIPGECKPLPHLGEACPYQRCAERGAVCDATGHCAAIGLPGKPCMIHADCSPFTECDMMNHVCIELPGLGKPCDIACAGDSFCDFNGQPTGTCVALQANGTPCDDPGTCASRNCKPGPVFDSCEDYPICF